jgi:putative membrane protein
VKTLTIALAVAGLALGTVLVAWFGAAHVLAAVLSVGWGGFALLCAAQLVLFAVLGASWDVIAPARLAGRSRLGWFALFVWGRAVRDSAGNCLPFTHLGGFVAGARAVGLHGVPPVQAAASTVADVTAEVLAQAIFATFGLVILVAHAPDSPLAVPVAVGLGVMLPALGGFVLAQQGAGKIVGRLSRHIAADWFANAAERAQVLQAEFALIYGHTARLGWCVAIHLAGWFGTGVLGWLTLRFLGVEIGLLEALAIEALLHALLAAAFLVPGHAGVQEAGYVALGAAFGVPAEIALAASLLRRAKDLAVGIPILLAWQGLELRALRARG